MLSSSCVERAIATRPRLPARGRSLKHLDGRRGGVASRRRHRRNLKFGKTSETDAESLTFLNTFSFFSRRRAPMVSPFKGVHAQLGGRRRHGPGRRRPDV